MKRLPAVILLWLTAPWAGSTLAAPTDPYAPPGGLASPAWRAQGAHPAVVRVTVPERESISLGSGVLVGHTEHLGLVVTNWHVVQDAAGTIMVAFPDGFRSAARLLKTDRHWDLAALAIWRPNASPVPLAGYMARPGETLTIAGYGSGRYRAATGRLVDYAAPATNFPFELLDVSTSARQGDSGGPIFNSRGEVAGVLFGTGGGRTLGSYSGRVRGFLLTVLPEFERLESEPTMVAGQSPASTPPAQPVPGAMPGQMAVAQAAADPVPPVFETGAGGQGPGYRGQGSEIRPVPAVAVAATPRPQVHASKTPVEVAARPAEPAAQAELAEISPAKPGAAEETAEPPLLSWSDLAGTSRAEQVKTVLAGVGVLFLVLSTLRLLGEVDGSRARKSVPVGKPVARRRRRAA